MRIKFKEIISIQIQLRENYRSQSDYIFVVLRYIKHGVADVRVFLAYRS